VDHPKPGYMNPLKHLDEVVTLAFTMLQDPAGVVHPPSFCTLLQEAVREAAQVKDVLLEHAFIHKDQDERKVFIEAYQAVCVHLINRVFKGMQALSALPYNKAALQEMERLSQRIQTNLLELLSFIQTHFYRSFDAEQVMPMPFAVHEAERLVDRMNIYQSTLEKMAGQACADILRLPVLDFLLQQREKPGSYKQLQIFSQYEAVLQTVLGSNGESMSVALLMHGFIQIDYCPHAFMQHYLASLTAKAEDAGSEAQSRRVWEEEYQCILVVQPIDKSEVTVQKIVLSALQHQLQKHAVKMTSSSAPPDVQPSRQQVLHTPLSVAQLALLVRLLVDAGAIECDNQTLLLKVIANSFTSKKAAQISPRSLRIKYYDTDHASVSIVKDYVIRMMNTLQRYKRD
jgi:hypothetical protein